MTLKLILVALLGYLLGGIPSAYLVGKRRGVDIRKHGSGNVGTTNAFRVLGWRAGLVVLVADVGKGAVATGLLPLLFFPQAEAGVYPALAGGLAAILGHVFTPYLRFRGGKGVATTVAVVLVIFPLPLSLIFLAVFCVVAFTTGFVSLGSLSAAAALPIATFLLQDALHCPKQLPWAALALALFLVFTHRENIRRLLRGTENRFRPFWQRRG